MYETIVLQFLFPSYGRRLDPTTQIGC